MFKESHHFHKIDRVLRQLGRSIAKIIHPNGYALNSDFLSGLVGLSFRLPQNEGRPS